MDLNKVFKCISWTSRGECFRVRARVIAGGHSGPVQLLRELGSIFCSKSDLFLVRVGPVMHFVTDSVYNFCGENSRSSWVVDILCFGFYRITSLLFDVVDVILLRLSGENLHREELLLLHIEGRQMR